MKRPLLFGGKYGVEEPMASMLSSLDDLYLVGMPQVLSAHALRKYEKRQVLHIAHSQGRVFRWGHAPFWSTKKG